MRRRPSPSSGATISLRRWRTLRAAVVQGQSRTVSVYGPSGIGKSTLIRTFIEQAEQRHAAIVLAGRCYENESIPYKGLDGVVDELSRHLNAMPHADVHACCRTTIAALARVFPGCCSASIAVKLARRLTEAGDLDPFQVRRRAFEALRSLLTRLAARRPLVMWIDDLQWADADSMQLLDELLAPPSPPAMLTLLSFRSEEVAREAVSPRAARSAGRHTDRDRCRSSR